MVGLGFTESSWLLSAQLSASLAFFQLPGMTDGRLWSHNHIRQFFQQLQKCPSTLEVYSIQSHAL